MNGETDSQVCVYCSKEISKDFKLRGLTIICPYCDRPQPNKHSTE